MENLILKAKISLVIINYTDLFLQLAGMKYEGIDLD